MKNRILIFIFMTAILLGGCQTLDEEYMTCAEEVAAGDETGEAEAASREKTDETIYVYICGEVVHPGVYEMKAGSRLYELIERAGGYTLKAAANSLNQAELLYDAQQIVVLSQDSYSDIQSKAVGSETAADDRININTADKTHLMEIPGIGDSRASDIIAYREKNGLFKTTEDIMQVPGIKEGLYSKIKDKIKI